MAEAASLLSVPLPCPELHPRIPGLGGGGGSRQRSVTTTGHLLAGLRFLGNKTAFSAPLTKSPALPPDPFFPLAFLVNSWALGTLDDLFQSLFLCALLLFWLCVYHGVRVQVSRPAPPCLLPACGGRPRVNLTLGPLSSLVV